MTAQTPGQEAYEAYIAALGWVSAVRWQDESNDDRAAWEAAAQAAIDWWHADRDLEPPREITVSPSELAAVRMVVAEMANHWERIGTTREEDELIAQWRARAGLEDM